jgi:uncharacterized membrane protein required for colicin V production
MMNIDSPVNWFDFAVVIILLLGINRGRKNGMSVELMPLLQWVAIIFAGAFLYKPLGDFLCQTSPVSHLFGYISMYIAIAIVVKIIFSVLKKGMGGKLAGSSVFGRGEYYLGMLAGAARFACVIVAALALINAPYYSQSDLKKWKDYQNDVYGSTYFDNLGTAQQAIFKESLLGSAIKNYAGFMLIVTTKTEHKGLERRKDDLP